MSMSDHLDLLWYMYPHVATCKKPCRITMGLQVGNKSAGRSVLLRFFLYPAVENIPGEIIFYRGLQTSHTRAEDGKNHFSPT